jgi:hypothetical protein
MVHNFAQKSLQTVHKFKKRAAPGVSGATMGKGADGRLNIL